MYASLAQANISTEGSRGYHILWNCALHGLICLATSNDKEQNFALVDEWLPPAPPKNHDEALAELAARYFLSRGPATLQDFIWWSSLSAAQARSGLAAIQSQLVSETVGKLTYWLPADSPSPKKTPSAFALPGLDEHLLGYKDRSAELDAAHAEKVCPDGNGVFAATLVIDGPDTTRRPVRLAAAAGAR